MHDIMRILFTHWFILRYVFLLAGILSSIGGIGAFFHHPYWIFLPIVVGVMQCVFALTGFCPSVILMKRLGIPCIHTFSSKQS